MMHASVDAMVVLALMRRIYRLTVFQFVIFITCIPEFDVLLTVFPSQKFLSNKVCFVN